MKINYAKNTIDSAIEVLDTIDCLNIAKKQYNQRQLHKLYNILDAFKEELIREKTKNDIEKSTKK